jgi:nitrogen fixation/metabolism regulation signal transduction histidine kinase
MLSEHKSETAFVTAALHEALTKLKAQERQMSARAEASERLSTEIVEGLTAGLLVVSSDQTIRILNPAARRMLNLSQSVVSMDYRAVLPESDPRARD